MYSITTVVLLQQHPPLTDKKLLYVHQFFGQMKIFRNVEANLSSTGFSFFEEPVAIK